jgi:Zn-dependent protease with chaperone function
VIADALESFLVFGTVLALIGIAAAGIARLAGTPPRFSAGLCTVALAAPPIAAAWIVAAALLPLSWTAEPEVQLAHGPARHASHLVGSVTAGAEVLVYAVLAVVGVSAAVVALSTARGHRRLAWIIARLEVGASSPPPAAARAALSMAARRYGIEVGLVESRHPFSFLWGFRRSKLVVSTGLLQTLTPTELEGVIEHEAAHHLRRDSLVRLVLTILAHATLAAPLARRVLRWRSQEVELLCDEAAAGRTGSPLDIAEALVKLRRSAVRASTPASIGVAGFVPENDGLVERRVRRLLALSDRPHPSSDGHRRGPGVVPLGVATLFLASLVAVATWAPLTVHLATEAFLRAFE